MELLAASRSSTALSCRTVPWKCHTETSTLVLVRDDKQTVKSHICDKQLKRVSQKLVEQAKQIAKPQHGRTGLDEIRLYNAMVMGVQNYYQIATHITLDCRMLKCSVIVVLQNQLKTRLRNTGYTLTVFEKKRYGGSKMLRCVAGCDQPIYPIGYIQHKNPMAKRRSICSYTAEGRKGLHDNLRINMTLMLQMMREPLHDKNAEYADNVSPSSLPNGANVLSRGKRSCSLRRSIAIILFQNGKVATTHTAT